MARCVAAIEVPPPSSIPSIRVTSTSVCWTVSWPSGLTPTAS